MQTPMMMEIMTSKRTDKRTKETLSSRLRRATLAKAWSSCVSLTNALMTASPVKLSCEKS